MFKKLGHVYIHNWKCANFVSDKQKVENREISSTYTIQFLLLAGRAQHNCLIVGGGGEEVRLVAGSLSHSHLDHLNIQLFLTDAKIIRGSSLNPIIQAFWV